MAHGFACFREAGQLFPTLSLNQSFLRCYIFVHVATETTFTENRQYAQILIQTSQNSI
jgi:hypothetical protein